MILVLKEGTLGCQQSGVRHVAAGHGLIYCSADTRPLSVESSKCKFSAIWTPHESCHSGPQARINISGFLSHSKDIWRMSDCPIFDMVSDQEE